MGLIHMWLYRCLASVFAVWVCARLVVRRDWSELRARFGRITPARTGPHVWVHGASNGELASVKPILAALLKADPDIALLVTSNTATGKALVESWHWERVSARLAPLDLGWTTAILLRRWRVQSVVLVEKEIWPHRILRSPGPVVLLGAQISDRSARTLQRLPGLTRRILGRLSCVVPQTEIARDRLAKLGVQPAALAPVFNLKALYTPEPLDDPDLNGAFDPALTWLAASTHAGEDALLLEAHRIARRSRPDLRLILAPRHPNRAPEILALSDRQEMAVRSAGEKPDRSVYLADTMGEMPLWYRAAGCVFVAGSLSDRGGHTPYEPAYFHKPVLHGPDTANFPEAYARLNSAGLCAPVSTPIAIAEAVLAALADRIRLGKATNALLFPEMSQSNRISEIVDATLKPKHNAQIPTF